MCGMEWEFLNIHMLLQLDLLWERATDEVNEEKEDVLDPHRTIRGNAGCMCLLDSAMQY